MADDKIKLGQSRKKPHKAKYKMNAGWTLSSREVAAPIPDAQPSDENDGVQRMYDYIADANQNPAERAYAAVEAFADSCENFAALVRERKTPSAEVITAAKHLLTKTLSHIDDQIAQSIKNGHSKV